MNELQKYCILSSCAELLSRFPSITEIERTKVLKAGLEFISVEPQRLERERIADSEVLDSLQRNGDCPSVVRSVDLLFYGSKSAVEEFAELSVDLGFVKKRIIEGEDGAWAIELVIQSDTTPEAIDNLTIMALKLGKRFDLDYDGWGTVAMSQCKD